MNFKYPQSNPIIKRLLILTIALLTTVGCAGKQEITIAPVSGTLTHKGKPIPKTIVSFVPETGLGSAAETKNDGTFELVYDAENSGATVGQHEVLVYIQGPLSIARLGQSAPATLTQTVEVAAGENKFDLKLEDFKVQK